jgi:hypothetical protein
MPYAIAVERPDLVDPHEARHSMFAAGFSGLSKIKKHSW